MSDLRALCAELDAINDDILRMAQELHSKARTYGQAAGNAAAAGRSAEGAGAAALARTAGALASAAKHCAQAASSLVGASHEGQAYVQRTIGGAGGGGASGGGPGESAAVENAEGPGRNGAADSSGAGELPENFAYIRLADIDDTNSPVAGPEHFRKGYSPEDLRWAHETLNEVVLPAMRRGSGSDYFQQADADAGRYGCRSLSDTYSGFFGADAIHLSVGPDGKYTVANGYHRIWVAKQMGLDRIPARIDG